MATMEFFDAAQMGPQDHDDNTGSYEPSSHSGKTRPLFYQNTIATNRIDETHAPSNETDRQLHSVGSVDGDVFQIPSASVDSTGSGTADGIPMNLKCADDDVDSALIAALRDPRERVSLLKTEQVLIDFMNLPDGYMEIGGPYNSIVLSQTGSITAAANSSNGNEFFGGRSFQSSFQRCWLHRLADRFNITREMGCLMEGSIRLVKIRESRIPQKLLVDLDPSEYSHPVSYLDDAPTLGLTQQFNSVSLLGSNNGSNNSQFSASQTVTAETSAATPKVKQPKKMKIMKRNSSSSFGSTGSVNKGGKGSTSSSTAAAVATRKGKNFSDKEKAYAEARARIFNDNSSSGATAGVNNGDPIGMEASSTLSCNPTGSSSAAASPITSKSPSVASSSAPSPSSSPPPSAVIAGLAQAIISDELSAPAVAAGARQSQQQQVQLGFAPRRPAAACAGGGNKATYRNRRQEESDPDFQRGLLSVPMMSSAYDASYMYGFASQQPQQQYYVYPDDGASSAASVAYFPIMSTPNACAATISSPIVNHTKGQPYGTPYSQSTYVNSDGNMTTSATAFAGSDLRRGQNNQNIGSTTTMGRGYYNPYAYSSAPVHSVPNRKYDARVATTSTTTSRPSSHVVPPYED